MATVSKQQVVTNTYTAQLTQDEVYALLAVLRHVGGSSLDTRRKHIDPVLRALSHAYDGDVSDIRNVTNGNSIYFVKEK